MFKKLALAAGFLAALCIGAMAAGNLTNGLPPAGGTQFPGTLPLTGLEIAPFDTQLPNGLNPATEAVSIGQIMGAVGAAVNGAQVATNTSAFTLTAIQSVPTAPALAKILNLTGTLAGAANVTTLTAAQIITAAGTSSVAAPTPTPFVFVVTNSSSGAFAWTLVGGTGVTVSGSAVIAQGATAVFSAALGAGSTIIYTRLQ